MIVAMVLCAMFGVWGAGLMFSAEDGVKLGGLGDIFLEDGEALILGFVLLGIAVVLAGIVTILEGLDRLEKLDKQRRNG